MAGVSEQVTCTLNIWLKYNCHGKFHGEGGLERNLCYMSFEYFHCGKRYYTSWWIYAVLRALWHLGIVISGLWRRWDCSGEAQRVGGGIQHDEGKARPISSGINACGGNWIWTTKELWCWKVRRCRLSLENWKLSLNCLFKNCTLNFPICQSSPIFLLNHLTSFFFSFFFSSQLCL